MSGNSRAYVADRPGDYWEDRDRVLRLTSMSFAYPAVLSDRRAPLSLQGPLLDRAYGSLRSTGHQAFLMSTCLRVEIAWAAGPESTSDILASLYGDGSVSEFGAVRTDEAAFVHLCRVAAGLDSPLIGEKQVLSQFRSAAAVCHEMFPSSGLGRALGAAIGIGRAVRRVLGNEACGSLAALAASEAAPFGRVAILGAGAMARAAVDQLDGVEVAVFARSPGVVAGHETIAWEASSDALATYPVVISTVPGTVPLFTGDVIARAFALRDEPLLLIDLGMPPGFPRPEAGGSIRYLGVDEVASSVGARPSVEGEETVLRGAAAGWQRLSAPDRVGAVIAAMVEQADTAVAEEVKRFASRLSGADNAELVLRQLAHTVARRILHPPISFVSSTDRGVEAVEVVAEAFGIDDD